MYYGLRFYARLADLPDWWIGAYEDRTDGSYALFHWPFPESLPEYVGNVMHEGFSFPWGIPVWPDNP